MVNIAESIAFECSSGLNKKILVTVVIDIGEGYSVAEYISSQPSLSMSPKLAPMANTGLSSPTLFATFVKVPS